MDEKPSEHKGSNCRNKCHVNLQQHVQCDLTSVFTHRLRYEKQNYSKTFVLSRDNLYISESKIDLFHTLSLSEWRETTQSAQFIFTLTHNTSYWNILTLLCAMSILLIST